MRWLSPFMLRPGAKAPNFTLPDPWGTAHNLDELLLGRRILLLDFFFLDCTPGRHGFSHLEKMQRLYAHRGLAAVAISCGDSAEALQEFARARTVDVTVLLAPREDQIFRDYRILAYPSNYLIGADCRIRWRQSGHDEGRLVWCPTSS